MENEKFGQWELPQLLMDAANQKFQIHVFPILPIEGNQNDYL